MEEQEETREEGNGVTIIIHKDKTKQPLEWNIKSVKILSIIHVAAGLAALNTQILLHVHGRKDHIVTIFEGYVASILYLVTGTLGLMSLRKPNKCMVSAFLVFSILSAIWTLVYLVFGACSLGDTVGYEHRNHPKDTKHVWVSKTLLSLQIITALVQGFTTIASSSMCCGEVCCRKRQIDTNRFKPSGILVLSSIQLVVGSFCIICFLLNIFVIDVFSIFEEIWCGIFFVIIGIVGLFAARRQQISLVTVFLILNIFGSLFTIVMIVTTSIKLGIADNNKGRQLSYWKDEMEWLQVKDEPWSYNCTEQAVDKLRYGHEKTTVKGFADPEVDVEQEPTLESEIKKCEVDRVEQIRKLENMIKSNEHLPKFQAKAAILSLQLIVVLLELTITIICASLSCRACCCLPSSDTTAVYIPQEKLTEGSAVIHVSKNSGQELPATDPGEGDQYARLK